MRGVASGRDGAAGGECRPVLGIPLSGDAAMRSSRLLKNSRQMRLMTDSVGECQRRGLMRGTDERTAGLFSYVRLEDRVAADHPLRVIRPLGRCGAC